jgi:hypothetical protein
VEECTGVRAAFGGVHPGRGTRNALLALDTRSYLEIMAPDPAQTALTWFYLLPELSDPRLVAWILHPDDVPGVAQRLRQSGIACDGPNSGSRLRPDGRRLGWEKLDLLDDRRGLLPSFIAWQDDSPHPAEDAPSGCRLARFSLTDPHPEELTRFFGLLDIDLTVVKAERPSIRAHLVGPAGACELTS